MSKGELTRQRIVALAAPVFNQQGFAGTALSDLMGVTGLEKGGIYRHFESKQQLAEEAFDYAWEIAMDLRFKAADAIPNAVDRLRQTIRNFSERRTGLVAGGCPLLNTATDSDDSNPRLREKARAALHMWLDRLQSMVEEGQRRGEIRQHIDAVKLATWIVSTLEGSLMVSRLTRKNDAIEIACHHLEEYLESEVRAVPKQSAKTKR